MDDSCTHASEDFSNYAISCAYGNGNTPKQPNTAATYVACRSLKASWTPCLQNVELWEYLCTND